ncbi:GNAT family N-acetyltransferase [Cnuibacter sp. UC19_7]|uniref:GNAT family N-acetyltransferase n=1 Tax=Cnuibacter sp. UC19_7 TaxID=3350166 RepID=UPI00366DF1CF
MSDTPDYRFRTFPASVSAEGAADPDTAAWLRAESQGFHEEDPSDSVVGEAARNLVADGRQLTGVYIDEPLPGSYGTEVPVATFADFEDTINVGGGRLLPAHLIASVTVRPTHRRRGLLRRMMTESLDRARERGLALAALTVSEATIYRRFGFGMATSVHHVEVDTGPRFRLLTRPAGRVELTDPRALLDVAPRVFARFHERSTGSVGREERARRQTAGRESEKGGPDARIRAALHYDEAGEIDGYVAYRSLGWKTEPLTIKVVDLVAATDDAYLGLWDFLATIDLNERVTFGFAPVDDPLRWALTDSRALKVTELEDWVWLRILDPIAALEARPYATEGELTIHVDDDLGHAAGTFRIAAADGFATVTREFDAAPDVTVDASTLASLYLGGADARVLAAAGAVQEHTAGAAARLHRLLASDTPVYGISHF